MTTKKRKRKKRRDSLVLNLLIIVVVVLVLFEGRLIVTLFTHRSDVASSTVSDGTVSSESEETLSESSSSASQMHPPAPLAVLPLSPLWLAFLLPQVRPRQIRRKQTFRLRQKIRFPIPTARLLSGKLPRRWMILISPTQYLSGIPEWKASGTLPELPRVSFSPV